jgi:hypothetical protein
MRHAQHADDRIFRLYASLFLLDFMSEHGQAFNGNQPASTAQARAALQRSSRTCLRAFIALLRCQPTAHDYCGRWARSVLTAVPDRIRAMPTEDRVALRGIVAKLRPEPVREPLPPPPKVYAPPSKARYRQRRG